MELLLLVFFCLLTGSEVTFGAENEPKVIRVEEGSDVILPCSLNTTDITNKKFVWKKDGRQVFLYDDEDHSNNAGTGQDQQFKGRVSHFPDKLKSGDASITIRNTMVADSGNYTCEFPDLQPKQIFHIQLVVAEVRAGDTLETTVIIVEKGSDVILPCSLNTTEDITNKTFVWKKDGHQVFLYDEGYHSNNVGTGQDQQFIQRVKHFPDELKSGNASIIISNIKVTDSGLYTCEFPNQPQHIFHIKLVFDGILKDRTGENIPGSAPKPSIQHLKPKNNREALLQCEAHGNPQPELRWQNSEGNNLPAEEPQVSKQGDQFYVTLQITVKETGVYRCVATQKDISHQIYEKTYVEIPGFSVRWVVTTIVLAVILVVVLSVVTYRRYRGDVVRSNPQKQLEAFPL